MNDSTKLDRNLAFEEFKLFYESAEKVTDRRHAANRWNYSICIAILIAVSGISNWGLGKPAFFTLSIIVVIILCMMAMIFCTLWIGQIQDFKSLNNAKFEILNQMAPQISFGESDGDRRVSFSPFEREWDALKKTEAVQEEMTSKTLALKSSNLEFLVPKAFRVLFLIILIAVGVVIYRNWESITDSSFLIPKTEIKKTSVIG